MSSDTAKNVSFNLNYSAFECLIYPDEWVKCFKLFIIWEREKKKKQNSFIK